MDIIVVDGPNLYNVVGARLDGAAPAGRLKAYLAAWFDLDRLILATVGASHDPALGIVTFHSKRALGRGTYHLDPKETDLFWGRQGSNPNSSCELVDIPSEQQETYAFECKKCGHPQQQRSGSEKGVDTSITTYLLETAGRWQSVCIVSKDVDFVPPVRALRRHGKQVYCAVEESAPVSALVRSCQSSFPINVAFLACDFALHEFLAPEGALDRLALVLANEATIKFAYIVCLRTTASSCAMIDISSFRYSMPEAMQKSYVCAASLNLNCVAYPAWIGWFNGTFAMTKCSA
jgi:hypothetical protein